MVKIKGNRLDLMSNAVIPAKAGIQCMLVYQGTKAVWIPAFAGMTMVGSKRLHSHKSVFSIRRIWSIISSVFGSSDLSALRRYKLLMWLGHTARFAPGIAFLNLKAKCETYC